MVDFYLSQTRNEKAAQPFYERLLELIDCQGRRY
ncbi:hypothetical protein F6450_02540 [Photobacterium damselae subsp. damselae]|uniref:Uncharacterized protein n=1 Tax=Photobacterium damselae subsp. damselae TaxID=85581 RepID=A0AAD3WYB2_PHODD|nr:hypothetical protein F6450_02540 [Photobacterium damselae subsp. damselae]